MNNVMEAYNWQLAQMWLGKIKDIIEPGKIYVTDNIKGYGRYDTFGMLADYLIMKGHKAVLYMCSNNKAKDVHNNILQRIETHMYEQAFSPDKENDERSFDEICDEALKLFKSQCDNIHFKAIDDRDVELLSDDNGHNKYNVILIEHFRLLQSRHTTYKSMSQEMYKYCVQYLHDMAKKYGYVIIVGMHINNTEEWLNNWMKKI